MLQRIAAGEGLAYYISPLLARAGVRHAFSTRLGGISPPPFDSLNLGNPNGCEIQDDYSHIWENYRLLLSAIGCRGDPPLRVHQVHGSRVVHARRGQAFDTAIQADAIVSDDPDRPVSVRVADCVPLLLASEDGRVVAAVHAGWRGVVAGVAAAAVSQMLAGAHCAAEQIIAAIGPCIGFDAFEVGPEVLAEFRRVFGPAAPVRHDADRKGRVDLRQALRLQLTEAGLRNDRIDISDRCTFRDGGDFFSHRRDHGITGRMAAVIAAASPQGS